MGDSSNLFSLMLLLIPIGLVVYFIKKKKKGDTSQAKNTKRRENDEVWKTLKTYIKKNSEFGKEIIESYVAKRPDANFIDKSLSKKEVLERKKEIKQKELEEKEKRKLYKKEKKRYSPPQQKELYVVLFTTRNPKTLKEDKPRAIECQVVNKKIDKKNFEREIVVTRSLDYEKESKWILPIKEKEEIQFKKEQERKEKTNNLKLKVKKGLKIKDKNSKKKKNNESKE